jgi:aminoglycoside 6-adenylyltransferase
MSDITRAYAALLDRFVAWAHDQPDIRGAFVLGSRARTERPADDWSDLDLVVCISDPQRLLKSDDCLEALGTPLISFLEPAAAGGLIERRFLFDGGIDVDLIPLPLAMAQQFNEQGLPEEVAEVIRRGARIVLDKDALLQRMMTLVGAPPAKQPPSPEAFSNLVNDFWYHAVWTSKKLRRGELWTAKFACDGYMKRLLLTMLQWHAQATHGLQSDTWHNGRFLEQWGDPRAVAALADAFAHYNEADVRRALFATMDVFRELASETAERLGYAYPQQADAHATRLVERYLHT